MAVGVMHRPDALGTLYIALHSWVHQINSHKLTGQRCAVQPVVCCFVCVTCHVMKAINDTASQH